ncbi:MAG: HD domain-containing protein [Bdellovibrionales bacterium]
MDLRDPIHGNIPLVDAEVSVLDCRAYQRLRAIKQLGFSEFSFPGATHNRYLHSLGVCHLAGQAFDSIFAGYKFGKADNLRRLRQTVRLAALLHDIGHGPLSHASEEVMPPLKDLEIRFYENVPNRQANHEDYTLKFILDSSLTDVLRAGFPDIDPYHIACLIDKTLPAKDDFFIDSGLNLRPILGQIVSSEMDVDRLDYLERDAYFCGTNYGKIETEWLLANLTYHIHEDNLHLALNRRALYTFDDFLLARHHMHLMVYFHHKSIIFEELLYRYLTSPDNRFHVPAKIEEYIECTDWSLFQHLAKVENPWAKRMVERRPFRMLFELHTNADTARPRELKERLEAEGIEVIHSNSQARLSKYHSGSDVDKSLRIFVVDQYDAPSTPYLLEQATEIFQRYEHTRRIDRVYVPPEKFEKAEKILARSRE